MPVDVAQLEAHRPVPTGHRSRMLGSPFDAEDVVREAGTPGILGARRFVARTVLAALAFVVPASPGAAQTPDELKRMTLEELMSVEVSSISRIPGPATRAPAAVFIITRDDIRRSGVTSIPDALRLAPGLHVARIDASRWAIGVRGFADRLARSILVRIDGRAVYSPLFAGTYWEVQNTLLEDVERIEVIRGPGGTLWGANAVNGIINIVTRRAGDTQGTLLTASSGSDALGALGARYGGTLGTAAHYRVYGKGVRRGAQYHAEGADVDRWWMAQGGFRLDWTGSGAREFTLQGDVYEVRLGTRVALTSVTPPSTTIITRDAPLSGANLLARWSGPLGQDSDFQFQVYYDRTNRDEIPVSELRDTFDVDFQQTVRGLGDHLLVWGAGYRLSSGRITTMGPTEFFPAERTDSLFSALLQDEFTLIPGHVRVAAGTKVEHNDYSGFEVQPSGRLTWTPGVTHTVVGSITRAVRTPSRVETDYQTNLLVDPAGPVFVRLQPNPDFETEELIAYELGYRVRPADTVYVTASGFVNRHDDLLSTELLTPFEEAAPPPPRRILPVTFANTLHGRSYGIELTVDARPASWWRWTTNYSYLQVDITRDDGSADVSQEENYENRHPRHSIQLQSSFDLTSEWSFDWLLRYVSALRDAPVPGYATSDIRAGWRIAPQVELALVGENLHEARHAEWPGDAGILVQRSGYVSLVWRTR